MNLFKLLLSWPKPFISGTDLALHLDKSADSRHAIIKRSCKDKTLVQIRRDLYFIPLHAEKELPDAFAIAPIIYGPSYISYESALSFHEWIPESVPSILSSTTKRTKEFTTPLGVFSYKHIPIFAFHMGVGQYKTKDGVIFIADPWKALADMIYVQKRVWSNQKALREDLRIDSEKIGSSNFELLDLLAHSYPSLRTRKQLLRLYEH